MGPARATSQGSAARHRARTCSSSSRPLPHAGDTDISGFILAICSTALMGCFWSAAGSVEMVRRVVSSASMADILR